MAEQVVAPLAGKIVNILADVGAEVEEDEEIMVIEAMKMETSVFAPVAGKISEIRVKKGDEVEEDDLLAVIESA